MDLAARLVTFTTDLLCGQGTMQQNLITLPSTQYGVLFALVSTLNRRITRAIENRHVRLSSDKKTSCLCCQVKRNLSIDVLVECLAFSTPASSAIPALDASHSVDSFACICDPIDKRLNQTKRAIDIAISRLNPAPHIIIGP